MPTVPNYPSPAALKTAVSKFLGDNSFKWFLGTSLILAICFSGSIKQLAKLSFKSELYSHLLLVPVVALYFLGISYREMLSQRGSRSFWGVLPAALGIGLLYFQTKFPIGPLGIKEVDYLSFNILSLILFIWSASLFWMGTDRSKTIMFSLGFLLFLVPFPKTVEHGIEIFFQYASADAAAALFKLTPTPVLREGLLFDLPGISLQVAEECSGIRSSFVLFITSILAGKLFLESKWKRTILALIVIPLGIVRNGIRVLVLGVLCVYSGPHMIDSPVHHQGGPLFFALSLIPFFFVLWLLRKADTRKENTSAKS